MLLGKDVERSSEGLVTEDRGVCKVNVEHRDHINNWSLFWGSELLHQPSEKLQLGILEGLGPAGTSARKQLQKKQQGANLSILLNPAQGTRNSSRFQETVKRRNCLPKESATTTSQQGWDSQLGCRWAGLQQRAKPVCLWASIPHCLTLSLQVIPKISPFLLGPSCWQQSESIFPLNNYGAC